MRNSMETNRKADLAESVAQKSVPVIDITPFTTPDKNLEAKRRVAAQLAAKASINGCVGITGHGITEEVLMEAFTMAKKLFALPFEDKMTAPHPNAPNPHRGYSGTGREHAAKKTESENWESSAKKEDYEKLTDYKESYEIGSDDNSIDYNIWLPDEMFPGFRSWGLDLYWMLHATAMSILEALMMSLELNDQEMEEVKALHTGHDHQLRLLHYPPIGDDRAQDQYASRLGAHTDWR
jgi:isopenicillin N synthase-like dioxygenase